MRKIYYSFFAAVALMAVSADAVASTRSSDVITVVEGEPIVYDEVCSGYKEGHAFSDSKSTAEIVFAEDNSVYIKDFFGPYPTGAYIKGEISDNKISISLPQLIDANLGACIGIAKLNADNQTLYDDEGTITLTVNESGVITMDDLGAGKAIDIVIPDWGNYTIGIGVTAMTLTPQQTEIENVAVSAGVAGIESYDLQGRRISASATGVVIEKQFLSDGTVRTVKKLRK